MGNCCPTKSDESLALNSQSNVRNPNAFQGEGHRLGTASDIANRTHNSNNNGTNNHDIPKPIIDENLTDADREKIRANRAAAAEARLKKQGLPIKPKKTPPVDANAPLRGPNSKPAMTWSLG